SGCPPDPVHGDTAGARGDARGGERWQFSHRFRRVERASQPDVARASGERRPRAGRQLHRGRRRPARPERLFRVATRSPEPRPGGHSDPPHKSAGLPVPARDRGAAAELAAAGPCFPLYWRCARGDVRPRELEPGGRLQAGARGRGRSGLGHRLRYDPPKAGASPGVGQHPLQSSPARPDRPPEPGDHEGERGTSPAGAADHRASLKAGRGGGQVRATAVAAAVLGLGGGAASAQEITIGPQVVLASYREVVSRLRYSGIGVGGAMSVRFHKLSAEAAVTRVKLDKTDGSAATTGFTATQVDAWVAYDLASYASLEVGVVRRSADPELDAQ